MKKYKYFISYHWTDKVVAGFGNIGMETKKPIDITNINDIEKSIEKRDNLKGVIIINIIKM